MKTFTWRALTLTALFLVSRIGAAATYNFYFNNAEQGDNSTAAPTVIVQDDKPAPGPSPSPSPSATSSAPDLGQTRETPPVPSAAAAGVSTAPVASQVTPTEDSYPRFRVGLSYFEQDKPRTTSNYSYSSGSGGSGSNSSYGSSQSLSWSYEENYTSAGIEGAFFISRFLGVNAFLASGSADHSALYGAELEWSPIRISFGHIRDLVEIGLMFGISNVNGPGENDLEPHGGARIGLNLTNQWGIQASSRTSNGSTMAQFGLTIRI